MKKCSNKTLFLDFGLVLSALFMIICPLINITNLNYILSAIFTMHGFAAGFKFLINKNYRDFENLYITASELVFSLVLYFFDITSKAKTLAYFMLIWILVMGVIKLIKSDYLHDLNKPNWLFHIISMLIFIVVGFVTCLNFKNGNDITIIVLGYFFLINYIMELLNQVLDKLYLE